MAVESGERVCEKVFPNGDFYLGELKGMVPHGKGKYNWSGGTVYDGDWEEGKMTGKGQMSWPSGARYEGDFSGGYLHGFGTLTSFDGSVYRGSWKMNTQYGIGIKQYQNSDVYDGCWEEGVRDGSGRYTWSNGNSYVGNWKSGRMCGRGVMKWFNGDVFDGSWLQGLRHGSGCYRFSDGSYYFGTWTKGLKDGLGTFYPTGSKHLSSSKHSSLRHEDKRRRLLNHCSSVNSEESVKPSVMRSLSEKMSNRFLRASSSTSQRSSSLDECWVLDESIRELLSCDMTSVPSQFYNGRQGELQNNSPIAREREYMQGVLIKERTRKISCHKKNKRSKYLWKKLKKKLCVDIFEGHRSCYLMLNLQLGIRYTVGKITPVPMREVRPSDFGERARIKMYFPRKGSQFTPPHRSIDFYWKDYCPMVFRILG